MKKVHRENLKKKRGGESMWIKYDLKKWVEEIKKVSMKNNWKN